MTNPIRDTVYTVTVPVDLSAAVLAACRAEAAAGIKRAPTPMMRVLPPLTAAAACAAVLGVALYLGGNTPDDLPVLPPVGNEDTTTTTEVTEATDSTAKPTTKDTTTTTTAKPTTTTTAEKTTTTTTAPYILVGGEDDYEGSPSENIPSLKDRLVSPALEEKMKEYRDVNAVYQVVIFFKLCMEDEDAIDKLIEADEEYQSLEKQYKEARKALKEANKREDDCEYPYDDPRKAALTQERIDAEKKKCEISCEMGDLRHELFKKFVKNLKQERFEYAAQFSKTEPIKDYCQGGDGSYGCYMELTADAINELIDRGGYDLFLASKLDSYRLDYFAE